MRRLFTCIAALCALTSGAALIQLKYAVQEQAENVEAIARQIHQDQESLRILEAEWAYLTSPRTLQELSIEFLALMPPSSKQVVGSVTEIPLRRSREVVGGDTSVLLSTADKKSQKNKQKNKQPSANSAGGKQATSEGNT